MNRPNRFLDPISALAASGQELLDLERQLCRSIPLTEWLSGDLPGGMGSTWSTLLSDPLAQWGSALSEQLPASPTAPGGEDGNAARDATVSAPGAPLTARAASGTASAWDARPFAPLAQWQSALSSELAVPIPAPVQAAPPGAGERASEVSRSSAALSGENGSRLALNPSPEAGPLSPPGAGGGFPYQPGTPAAVEPGPVRLVSGTSGLQALLAQAAASPVPPPYGAPNPPGTPAAVEPGPVRLVSGTSGLQALLAQAAAPTVPPPYGAPNPPGTPAAVEPGPVRLVSGTSGLQALLAQAAASPVPPPHDALNPLPLTASPAAARLNGFPDQDQIQAMIETEVDRRLSALLDEIELTLLRLYGTSGA